MMVATHKRLPMARQRMSLPMAISIVGSDLGRTSKLPGRSLGISVADCKRGKEMHLLAGTVCGSCYARVGHYTSASVAACHSRRLEGIEHPRWSEAVAYMLAVYGEDWFRWFDSGDLQSVDHLRKICDVARRSSRCAHWLPTHEPGIVGAFLRSGGIIPDNLCIRISADYIEDRPIAETYGLSTSTVHRWKGEPVPAGSGLRKHSIECKSYLRENRCGRCRACWEPRVKNVSYPLKWERR